MATAQDKIKAKLETLGIPFRSIEVYGSQIMVTCASRDAAIKWATVLGKFARVRGAAVKSIDYLKADTDLPNARRTVDVWRTGATV